MRENFDNYADYKEYDGNNGDPAPPNLPEDQDELRCADPVRHNGCGYHVVTANDINTETIGRLNSLRASLQIEANHGSPDLQTAVIIVQQEIDRRSTR